MYKIEKNIPIPNQNKNKFPFPGMSINDSFLVPKKDYENETAMRLTIMNGSISFAKKQNNGFKVSVRATDAGLRVWRVK